MSTSRRRTAAASGAAALAVSAAVAGCVLLIAQRHLGSNASLGTGPDAAIDDLLANVGFMASRAISAVLFATAGWYLATRRPNVGFGPLALAAGMGDALAVLGGQLAVYSEAGGHRLAGASVALWIASWGLAVEPVALVTTFVLFPDGTLPRGLSRWPGLLSIGLCAAGLVHSVAGPLVADPAGPYAHLTNPLGLHVLPGLNDAVLIFPGLVLGAVVLLVRWRRAHGEARRILGPLAIVTALSLVPLPFLQLGAQPDVNGELFVVITLVAVMAGVLRHRVYGIEVVLNRTLVYALLTLLVAATYAVVVGAINLLGSQVTGTAGVLPAVVAAFALFPARQRVQRLVNRFLYGQRDEPYAVVTGIAARLEGAAAADQLLPHLLDAIVESLRVPSAAVEIRREDGTVWTITSGKPSSDSDRFPLVHQSHTLGDLVVGRRSGQVSLPAGERALLGDIARHAAVAVSNVTLTEELLRSRERIINAAEEERRRLRRDLHDGLGPVLTAAASRVDAARNLLLRDTDAADRLLEDVRRDVTSALDDLRRLVYALRPPALDELGLVGALREHVRRSSVPVVLRAPDTLPDLPPAVEVAAYRIISEAITNVCRHAGASSCTVLIGCDGALSIDVQDDGRSASVWAPGVGLSSMRERTIELGGSWSAGPAPDGGGRVHVELPVAVR